MATNLDLDPALVDEAVAVGGRRTKKETVTEALREYIARRRQAVEQLRRLVDEGRVAIIGPIRQELLSGIAAVESFA
jgi:Arc/MetJ family transcription regulator